MKKIIAIIAVMAVMLTFFAACGKKKGDVDFSGDNNSKVVAPTNSTTNTSSEISSEDKELNDACVLYSETGLKKNKEGVEKSTEVVDRLRALKAELQELRAQLGE